MNHEAIFNRLRPLLFSIAYRMVGSVMVAEDLVQEAYLRWHQVELAGVTSPKAYLTTVTTRLCLDYLRSAQVERESYVGLWLPEPLVQQRAGGWGLGGQPAEQLLQAESLSMAFLVLLQSLSPIQRAIFLLHDVFDYTYREIAEMLGEKEATCRQLGRRARQYIQEQRPRFEPEPARQAQLMEQFWVACQQGDLSRLMSTLAEDVALWSDSGGKVPAARKPVQGADPVARFLLGIVRRASASIQVVPGNANGQPAIFAYQDGTPTAALLFQIAPEGIAHIYIVLNPDKLQALLPLE